MVYAEFGGQTECIMGNWKIENWKSPYRHFLPWGATQRILILGGSAPRSNPLLNFYTIPFLTRKGPLSLALS